MTGDRPLLVQAPIHHPTLENGAFLYQQVLGFAPSSISYLLSYFMAAKVYFEINWSNFFLFLLFLELGGGGARTVAGKAIQDVQMTDTTSSPRRLLHTQ